METIGICGKSRNLFSVIERAAEFEKACQKRDEAKANLDRAYKNLREAVNQHGNNNGK